MADTTVPSGTEAPSGENNGNATVFESKVTFTKEQQEHIDAMLQAATKPLKDEAAKYRVEKKAAIEAEMTKNGQAVELAEQRRIKLEELEADNQIKTEKLLKIETDTKRELLERLPENIRDEYKEFGLDALRTVSKHLAIVQPSGNSQGSERGASGGGTNGVTKKELPLVPFAGSDAPSIKILADILNN